MQMLCDKVRKIEDRIWREELQRGNHLPGYGGYVSHLNEDSVANGIQLPRQNVPDMEDWGGKQIGYGGHKPMRACDENPCYMWNLDHSRHSEYRTTNGYTNMMCQRQYARMKYRQPITKKLCQILQEKKGLKGFFQEAGNDPRVDTSEQGKRQAEKFYAIVRPYEGTLLALNSSRSIKSIDMQ